MPQNYNKLKKLWYKKLKDSGFNDLEKENNEMRSLNGGVPYNYRSDKPKVVTEAIEAYYYLCRHFLNDHQFENERERIIWTYHTEGIPSSQIKTILKDAGITVNSKPHIDHTIRTLVKEMKRKYLVI